MTNRSICLGVAAAAFAAVIGLTAQASAAPGASLKASSVTALVQPVDCYGKRCWRHYYRDSDGTVHVREPFTSVDTNGATHVEAPFTTVDTHNGVWVRAPFVNLYVPR